MLPLGRNKVLGWIKQDGRLDLAWRPCVCHLWSNSWHSSRQPTCPLPALDFENPDLVSASCTQTEDAVDAKKILVFIA